MSCDIIDEFYNEFAKVFKQVSWGQSNAKLCIGQRKALHLPTQSFASDGVKLCMRRM